MALQIKKKFIAPNAIDGSKILLEDGQSIRKLDAEGVEFDVIASVESSIAAEKARVDAILSASEADKDSFAEIVNLINSVDTTNDDAFAAYVLSNDAALAAEVAAREAADTQLQSNIDTEAGRITTNEMLLQGLRSEFDQEVLDREAADNDVRSEFAAADSLLEGSLQTNIDAEAAAREAADNTLQTNIDAEAAAREAADDEMKGVGYGVATYQSISELSSVLAQELSDRVTAVQDVQSNVEQEALDREAADNTLQSKIDAEKARIDAILSASEADKDSFAEIVTLINSVDTDNDTAFAAYVLSNDAALAQEVSDRAALEGEFDAYVLSNDVALAAEVTDREAADASLQSQIDSITSAVGSSGVSKDGNSFGETMVIGTNDDFDFELERNGTSMFALTSVEAIPVVKSSSITLIDPLNNGKMFGFSMTDDDVNPENPQGGRELSMGAFGFDVHDALSIVGPSFENKSWVGSLNSGMFIDGGSVKATDGNSYVAPDLYVGGGFADPDSTHGRVQSGNLFLRTNDGYCSDGQLGAADSGDITIITGQGALGGQRGSVNIDARKVIIDTQSGVEVYGSFSMGGNTIDNVATPSVYHQATPKSYVDQKINQLSSDSLEALGTQEIEKFTLSATDITNGYIDLAEEVDSSKYKRMQAFVGRLPMHLDDDFTLSSEGGVTRVTFAGSMASGGAEALAEGDVVYVRYIY